MAEVGKGQETKEGARWKEAMSRARKDRFIVQRAAVGGTGGAGAGRVVGENENLGLWRGVCVCVCVLGAGAGSGLGLELGLGLGLGDARSLFLAPPRKG